MNTFSSVYATIAQEVVVELTNARVRKNTSYKYIPHTFSPHPIVKDGEQFQVLIIGGSVYKSAILTKKLGQISVISQEQGQQPLFDTEETFLRFISEKVNPEVSVIGMNFAYALDPLFERGRLDGLMVGGNMKDNAFFGLENKPLGTTIEQYLLTSRKQTVIVSAANDTICLLLSGLTQYSWDQVAAGIVGTGMNFALFENESTMINLESAHFDKFELSTDAKIMDKASQNPGRALLEKEVAGAYLHKLFNQAVKSRHFNYDILTSTEQIDEIAEKDTGEAGILANELLDRSASLVAAQIAGITKFLGRDTSFVMEGSLFWKGYRYRERVSNIVRTLLPDMNVSYINIPDSGIFGGAKLVA